MFNLQTEIQHTLLYIQQILNYYKIIIKCTIISNSLNTFHKKFKLEVNYMKYFCFKIMYIVRSDL